MTGEILLIDSDNDRRWRLAKVAGPGNITPCWTADILFGDFDRTRAERTAGILRRSLPANGLYVVRSGCEALEFIRHRGSQCDPKRRLPPILALLDEELSGMAGHSILRSMLRLPSLGEILVIILVDAGRAVAHLQWTPEADGYLEKPFTLRKLRNFIRSLGAEVAMTRSSHMEAPA